jgi:hypothetical protein
MISRRSCFLAATLCLVSNVPARAAGTLGNLRPGHPRLLVLNDQLPPVRQMIESDPLAKKLHGDLQKQAEELLGVKPRVHELTGPEHSLLTTAREIERRVFVLAGLYRLDGDRRFAERAREEMLAAAAFPDWNPAHFLDTAETTAALAVGYDWLYDVLSAEDRAAIRAAIIAKGLNEGRGLYEKKKGFTVGHNNWNQVCNGGMLLGALALADTDRELAVYIVEHSVESIRIAMNLFAPDGGFEEGPTYWDYAMKYNVMYLAAMESALATDAGLDKMPGFGQTGWYRIHTLGPLHKQANFADCGEGTTLAVPMFWLARHFKEPAYNLFEREVYADVGSGMDRLAMLALMWTDAGSGGASSMKDVKTALDAKFDRVNAAFLRGGWGDAEAFYVAFKGGDSRASHGHLDLGSFVLDALGQRWAIDLGADSYGLPGYFGKQRWTYFRCRTESHNTLTIDGENEDLDASAPLVKFYSTPSRAHAVADLSSAYKKKLSAWARGVALLDRKRVLVQDEVRAKQPVEIAWGLLTRAQIELRNQGREAVLTAGKSGDVKSLRLRILLPAEGAFRTASADAPAPQASNPGVTKLVMDLRGQTSTRIVVLVDSAGDDSPAPKIEPLAQWAAGAAAR